MGGSVCRVLVGRNGECRMKTDEAVEILEEVKELDDVTIHAEKKQ